MTTIPSTMLPLGTPLPEFRLINAVDGREVGPSEFKDPPGWLVMFICNHCPYVIHVRRELLKLAHESMDRGLAVLAINSNSTKTHPNDGPEHMSQLARQEGWRFPFLFDESQALAKTFRAACTPDFYVFDRHRKLAYRGQMDDSRPKNAVAVTGKDLRAAIDAVLAGRIPSADQKPSIGCNIKWAPGNEPDYFR